MSSRTSCSRCCAEPGAGRSGQGGSHQEPAPQPLLAQDRLGNGPEDTRSRITAGPASKNNDKALPSPWIPSLTLEAEAPKREKVSRTVTYYTSGKPLRMSALPRKRVRPLEGSVAQRNTSRTVSAAHAPWPTTA